MWGRNSVRVQFFRFHIFTIKIDYFNFLTSDVCKRAISSKFDIFNRSEPRKTARIASKLKFGGSFRLKSDFGQFLNNQMPNWAACSCASYLVYWFKIIRHTWRIVATHWHGNETLQRNVTQCNENVINWKGYGNEKAWKKTKQKRKIKANTVANIIPFCPLPHYRDGISTSLTNMYK